MNKSIHTLVPDIYKLLGRTDGWFSPELAKEFGLELGITLRASLSDARTPYLRLSQMGPKCPRALWHSIHHPELDEVLPPQVKFKYQYGHIIEALVIALAKSAGHEVTGEQDELTVDGIRGHRDCVIDGCLVDVKSVTSRGFEKYENKTLSQDDPFGYLDQLDGYLVGSANDDLVRVKDKAYIFAVDKNLGHMCLYEHNLRQGFIEERIRRYKGIVSLSTAPACECGTRPYGKSGNIELDIKASYSAQKHTCFPHLRTFIYSSGPVYLSKVVRRPENRIVEVDKHGRIVYNYGIN